MADELDSGSSARKGVWVQVPSSAFIIRRELSFIWKFFFVSISIIPNISLYTKKSIKKEKN